MQKVLSKKNIHIFFPLLHFLFSFIYERKIFIFSLDKNVVTAIPLNNIISDRFERIEAYIFSKFFAFIFIFVLWNILFSIIENRKKAYIWLFTVIGIIGAVMVAMLWPIIMSSEVDNYVTYSYAIRFFPEYWHSAYSGFIFSGMLMAFPHPCSIYVIQFILGIASIAYLFIRIRECDKLRKNIEWIVLIVFLVPGIFSILTHSYRTFEYAELCFFYFSIITMDIVEERKRPFNQLAFVIFLAAVVALWRSEGIIVGVLSIIIYIVSIYGANVLEIMKKLIVFFSFMLILFVPQKLGDMKYYGMDYSFMNTFNSLQNILNSSNANLNYNNVEEDILALSAVVPIDQLQSLGMEGYRRYNYACGRTDMNQSMATKESGKGYMQAYYSLVAHNIPIYVKTQLSLFTTAIGLTEKEFVADIPDLSIDELPQWHFVGWDNGKDDIFLREDVSEYIVSAMYQNALIKLFKVRESVASVQGKYHLKTIVYILIVFLSLIMSVKRLLLNYGKKSICLALLGASLLLQLFAIILVMPASFSFYLYPTLLQMLVLNIALITE